MHNVLGGYDNDSVTFSVGLYAQNIKTSYLLSLAKGGA